MTSMPNESKNFIRACAPVEREAVDDGITRQFLGYNGDIMMVRVWFDQGAVGQLHSHYHSQVSYVESGTFDVTVGDETHTLKAGDSFFIPPHVEHGAVCREAGVLLDVFSPVREDFLAGEGYTNET